MVATRRGAQTSAGGDTAELHTTLALRKKPIRKAAAKSSTAAPPKPVSKSRATRARKAEEVAQDSEDEDEHVEDASKRAPEPPKTRQAAFRAKKADAKVVEVLATKPAVSKPAVKTTRASKTRSKKPAIHNDEIPEIQPEPKARATRTTRAKAAMEKAKVLSPKKVTQVSRGPLRATKASAAKISSKPALLKAAAPIRSTRRRAVSDENAEVPTFREEIDEDEDEITISEPKQKVPTKPKQAPVIDITSDSEMSSRPTTPADSPKLDFSGAEKDLDEQPQESDSQHEESDGEASCASEDELCGPKTPMRRCSPREAARYSNSPTRRRGTPQTQKPPILAHSPISNREPMTLARATKKAMVFPELKPFSMTLGTRRRHSLTPQLEDEEDEAVELDGASSIHSDQQEMDSAKDIDTTNESSLLEGVQRSESEDVDYCHLSEPYDSHVPLPLELDNGMDEDMTEIADEEYKFEFDSTPRSGARDTGVEVFEDDNSVIIASNRRALEQVSPIKSFETRLMEATAPTPKPETLIWENIGHDDTLVPALVQGDNTPDSLPEPDRTEILSPAASFASGEGTERNTVSIPEDLGAMDISHDVPQSAHKQSRTSMTSNRLSLDGTIHLSQFIDVESLTEAKFSHTHQRLDELDMDIDLDMNPDDFMHSTPTKSPTRARESDQIQVIVEPGTPRYAQPTMASAIKRRLSLPAISFTTPTKAVIRPNTSDGASLSRLPFARPSQPSTLDDAFRSITSTAGSSQLRPVSRAGECVGANQNPRPATPRTNIFEPRTPSATTPRQKRRASRKIVAPQTVAVARHHDREAFSSRQVSNGNPSGEAPEGSTVKTTNFASKERYPGLPSRTTYESMVETPIMRDASCQLSQTPETVKAKRPIISSECMSARRFSRTHMVKTPAKEEIPSSMSSKKERYPGLPSRRTYEEHAKTAIVPTRFRTVPNVPAKRPASAMKASSLSELARRGVRNSGTPTKTPLKAPTMTPGQVPMTPHPAAPLQGVCALVDVWTNDASPASSAFIALLQRLGARTTKSWSKRLTHVVFKSGSPSTLQRLRLHNKEVEESGVGAHLFCVNSRWVTDCDTEGRRMDETDEEYAVDVEEACRGSKRRCKSMEPAALINIGGNVIRDRKSSLGRASLGRASLGRSPLKQTFAVDRHEDSPQFELPEKENSDLQDDSSPATPAYLAAPNLLIQQTAPLNRVRKLALGPKAQGKDRRTTVWDLEF